MNELMTSQTFYLFAFNVVECQPNKSLALKQNWTKLQDKYSFPDHPFEINKTKRITVENQKLFCPEDVGEL